MRPLAQKTDQNFTCTTRELAHILGVSDRRVQQLVTMGAFPRVDRGKYDLPTVVQSYIAFFRAQFENISDEELDLRAEKALLTRAQRKKVELELKIMQGELHRSDDVRRVMNDMLGAFRARCLSIPTKAAPRVQGKDLNAVKDVLKKEIYEALSELTDYDPEVFYKQSKDKLVIEETMEADDEKEPVERKRQNGRKKK
jgi:phage terminase Nu1 subunit (DNA packaging protein)